MKKIIAIYLPLFISGITLFLVASVKEKSLFCCNGLFFYECDSLCGIDYNFRKFDFTIRDFLIVNGKMDLGGEKFVLSSKNKYFRGVWITDDNLRKAGEYYDIIEEITKRRDGGDQSESIKRVRNRLLSFSQR